MYPFDHVSRNWDQRTKLHRRAEELLKKAEEEKDAAMDIEDDDVYDQRIQEIDDTIMAEFWRIALEEFSLCYPLVRNKWFTDVVEGFPVGTTRITEKQYHAFSRYCEGNDMTWRTGEVYARTKGKFVTLCRKNCSITINIRLI